jgi:aspartyl-tRNA(Asn)/glutamyl-tRNA(Gln) amidotransferase subunit B
MAHDGWIEIEVDGKKKKIGIAEMHIEEDAGKELP